MGRDALVDRLAEGRNEEGPTDKDADLGQDAPEDGGLEVQEAARRLEVVRVRVVVGRGRGHGSGECGMLALWRVSCTRACWSNGRRRVEGRRGDDEEVGKGEREQRPALVDAARSSGGLLVYRARFWLSSRWWDERKRPRRGSESDDEQDGDAAASTLSSSAEQS